jgi:hypothetical protein
VRSFRALGGHGLLMPIQLGTLRSSTAPRHDVPSLKTNAQRARKLYEANESFGYRSIRPQQKTDTSLGVGG